MDPTTKTMTEAMKKGEEMVANMLASATEGSADEKQAKVERAAAIATMLETPGGKLVLAEIERMMELVHYQPEAYFTELPDGSQVVNANMVARSAGVREGLSMMKSWFLSCKKLIEQEAKKNNEAKV